MAACGLGGRVPLPRHQKAPLLKARDSFGTGMGTVEGTPAIQPQEKAILSDTITENLG